MVDATVGACSMPCKLRGVWPPKVSKWRWSTSESLVPLDVDTVLDSVRRTGRAVVADYATEFAARGRGRRPRSVLGCSGRSRHQSAGWGPLPAHTVVVRARSAALPDVARLVEAIRTTVGFGR